MLSFTSVRGVKESLKESKHTAYYGSDWLYDELVSKISHFYAIRGYATNSAYLQELKSVCKKHLITEAHRRGYVQIYSYEVFFPAEVMIDAGILAGVKEIAVRF